MDDLKVLHVVHWPRSGIGVVVRDLIRHASRDVEHVVLCLAAGAPVTDQMRQAGGTVLEPGADRTGWRAHVSRLRDSLRTHRPDALHTHSLTPRVLGAVAGGAVPQVSTVHTSYLYFQAKGVGAWAKRRAECTAARLTGARYICVADDVASSLPCPAMARGARVVRNGIDVEGVRSISMDGAAVPRVGTPQLVAVGRLEWEKGFTALLPAIAAARKAFPDLGLLLCGDGGQRAALEEQARALGIEKAVHFAGYVENPLAYVHAADAFVSSSVQEGFALTVAEAMAMGKPVITTPVSGVSSFVRDGENAFVADGFDASAITAVLLRALGDAERLQRVAAAGHRLAVEHLDVRRVVGEYEAIYRDVIGMR